MIVALAIVLLALVAFCHYDAIVALRMARFEDEIRSYDA